MRRDDSVFVMIHKFCENLQELQLSDAPMAGTTFQEIRPLFAKLKCLRAPITFFENYGNLLPALNQIEAVRVTRGLAWSPSLSSLISVALPQLRELTLLWSHIRTRSFAQLLQTHPTIRKLALHASALDPDLLSCIADHLPRLESFSMHLQHRCDMATSGWQRMRHLTDVKLCGYAGEQLLPALAVAGIGFFEKNFDKITKR